MKDLIDLYFACWNETNSTTRRDLITKTWADDASYIDPQVDARGHDVYRRRDRRYPSHFPGQVFALAVRVDAVQDIATQWWRPKRASTSGSRSAETEIMPTLGGKALARVVGFLDKVPRGATAND